MDDLSVITSEHENSYFGDMFQMKKSWLRERFYRTAEVQDAVNNDINVF